MSETKSYTIAEAHRFFAANCFNGCWKLLDNINRTKEDDEELIHLAHTSLYHWKQAGQPINEQRGEWMLARVYTVLERKEAALHHALRCLHLTERHGFKDFDLAYSFECTARAYALAGDKADFEKYNTLASDAGKLIQQEEDKKLFLDDLQGGNWFGMK
jgi:hypothetical protein